nr:immunoglobulin heavy chain junction region [Homo sapiens]
SNNHQPRHIQEP